MPRQQLKKLTLATAVAVAAGAGALAWLVVRSVRRRHLRSRAQLAPPVRLVNRHKREAGASGAPAALAVHSPVVTSDAVRRKEKARAHVQFGQLLFKSGRLSKAISHFETAVALNGQNARAHFELAEAYQQVNDPVRAAKHYERVLELKPACVEAATNLGVAYLAAERAEDAIRMSLHAIELERARARAAANRAEAGRGGAAGSSSGVAGASVPVAINSEAYYNLNAALRACGRAAEAYEQTWRGIEQAGGTRLAPLPIATGTADGGALGATSASTASRVVGWLGRRSATASPPLTVVCVKWGSKYGSEYVNKLRRAVRQHTSLPFAFVCYTDEPAGLDKEVEVRLLDGLPGWDGWWLKACLFGPAGIKAGRVAYLDLDTIVVGSLDDLFSFGSQFATLAADEWACERDNGSGVNSSVMLWDGACAQSLSPIYEGLLDGIAFRHLMRFDHWLEMLLPARRPKSALPCPDSPLGTCLESVQSLFPGQVVEYKSGCAHGLPEGARLVCFPRSPKPHEVTDTWAQPTWHQL